MRIIKIILEKITGVSLFIKVMGIALFLIFLFGLGAIFQTKIIFENFFFEQIKDRMVATARYIKYQLEENILAGDIIKIREIIENELKTNRDVKYIIILDNEYRVLIKSIKQSVSNEFVKINKLNGREYNIECFKCELGNVCDIIMPLTNQKTGYLRIGISDELKNIYMSKIFNKLILYFLITAIIGVLISYCLSYILNQPIRGLISSIEKVKTGDYNIEIKPWFKDEIGELTTEFSKMIKSIKESQELRKKLMQRIISAQEEERLRISRELHDKTGQTIVYLKIAAKSVEKDIREEIVVKKFSEFVSLLNTAFEEIHNLILELRNPILNDFGLYYAIKEYLEKVKDSGIKYNLLVNNGIENLRLNNEAEIQIFKVIQESIINILKHSKATEVNIKLNKDKDKLIVKIEDNGKGFEVSKINLNESIGIFGMQERVGMIGGNFKIESKINSGTTISISVPIIKGGNA